MVITTEFWWDRNRSNKPSPYELLLEKLFTYLRKNRRLKSKVEEANENVRSYAKRFWSKNESRIGQKLGESGTEMSTFGAFFERNATILLIIEALLFIVFRNETSKLKDFNTKM